jgi:hypothetical protein
MARRSCETWPFIPFDLSFSKRSPGCPDQDIGNSRGAASDGNVGGRPRTATIGCTTDGVDARGGVAVVFATRE